MKRTERRFRRVHPFLDLGGCGDLLRDSTPESVRNAASAAHRDTDHPRLSAAFPAPGPFEADEAPGTAAP